MLGVRRPASGWALVGAAGLLIGLLSCRADVATPATSSTRSLTTAATEPARATRTEAATPGATTDVEDACTLVPAADVIAATDVAVDDGVAAGDERRRVCTFRAADRDVGITVGVEATGRFHEKAGSSRRSLGDDGEPIDGVGDAALFFFSDEDRPEGVGGTLVAVGEVTIDVTLQGLDEDAMRSASVAIAELVVSNL